MRFWPRSRSGLARLLRIVSWATPGLGAVAVYNSRDPREAQSILTVMLSVFFVLQLTRLVLAAVDQRGRRSALSMLFAAVLSWAVGSAVLNGSGQPSLTQFPSPGEWFFLVSYVALAGYLFADAGRHRVGNGTTWLDAAIVCGGTACLAGSLLVHPVAHRLTADGAGLLLTLLYPLIDIVLLLVVVAQLAVGYRGAVRRTLGLLTALCLFTAADLSFIETLNAGTYDYDKLNILMWGAGFALLVDHGCRAPRAGSSAARPRGLSALVVFAGLAASAVLAFEPLGPIRGYLLAPALATLAAGGARMVLALRAANRAAEATALSLSDDLTGLPNRRAMNARLEQRLQANLPTALMIMDLDGFKDINDTLGHAAGDTVLTDVAAHARTVLPDDVLLARLGGDEFAIVGSSADELDLFELAQTVLAAVREPLVVDGITLTVDASIGITVRQDQDQQPGEMLRRADIAMYDAKRSTNKSVLYDPSEDRFSRERLALSEELRCAIAERQLELWYQPKFDAVSRSVCGLEGLVRWRHPVQGILSPAEFLPIARRAGLMIGLSELVGRIATADLKGWQAEGLDPRIAINCAPPELMSGLVLPRLGELLRDAGLDVGRVTVEVTEDSFLMDPERARTILLDLHDLGFEISVDDFGTGFSSLSYLRDLPISELKMDRSFISAMAADPRSRLIVDSTFHMADALGLRMVAEGVEDEETAVDLVDLGVHVLQGYHLSRPIPARDVPAFLRQARAASIIAIAS